LAGADNDNISLYFIDYLAAMVPVKYGAQGYNYDSDNEIIILIILKLNIGYASNFILSVFDRYWREVIIKYFYYQSLLS